MLFGLLFELPVVVRVPFFGIDGRVLGHAVWVLVQVLFWGVQVMVRLGAVRDDGGDGFEALVTGMAFCEIDGWCRCCFWGPGDGQVCFCEIDGKVLGGHTIWGFLCRCYNILGCCLGCWLRCSSGAAVQSLARVSLSGVYAGVCFFWGSSPSQVV